MPNFPIVDTHLHVWNPESDEIRYEWLEEVPSLNKPFLLDDYNEHCGPVEVERMVFLQCDPIPEHDGKEVEWVTSLAQGDPRIQGIVSGASIEKGEGIRPFLEELAANDLVKGVRRLIQSEAIDFCLQPDFLKGVRMLAEYDLNFDICIHHPQLQNSAEMVRQCPNVKFILDHIGKPGIKEKSLDPWRDGIRELAALDNTVCKVSGATTEADHDNWVKEDIRPYIEHVVESFGADRCIYGGDWPVATQATTYPRWVETLDWILEGCSKDELQKIYHDNAIDFYRLPA
jgi:L-fuconolactonase